jgi:hypothetical protein
MRNPIGILVAIALVVVGVGVVRPHTIRLIDESWQPVAQERIEVPLTEGASVELNQLGTYILFLEGPAADPLWSAAGDTWVQLLDWQTRLPLDARRHGVDVSYELDGRRALGLSQFTVSRSGVYDLTFGRTNIADLDSRGFKVALSPAEQVTEQSRKATTFLVGGIAAGVLMGIIALSMLAKKPG